MYACVYIPQFLVQAIVRADPVLRSQAVAITDGAPPLCRVVAVNRKAARAGIKPGMSKLEATQLPELIIRQRSPAQEEAAHSAILDLGFAFSPRVEATAPDTMVLDLTGLEQLFGAPETIARDLTHRASALRLKVHVGVARNIDTAVHAARGGRSSIVVIPEGQEAEFLSSLPLEVLAPLPEILETFDRWGIRTFRALAALPTAELSERLGQKGVRLQALARGRTSRPLVPVEPALKFEETAELEYPVTLLDPLAFILGRLLDQLTKRLEARALGTNELRLTLGLENVAPDLDIGIESAGFGIREESKAPVPSDQPHIPSPESRTLRLPVPTRNSKLLLKLLLLHLKADPPRAPVLKITLAAEPARPRVAQGGLFLPLSPDPEKLEVTLARLAGVVGNERVGSPELEDSHQPDVFRMSRFNPGESRIANRKPGAGRKSKRAARRSNALESETPPPEPRHLRALRIFRPARPAALELHAGRPVRIFARGVRGDVVAVSGPWRTSGNWWRDKAWGEDEWDIGIWPTALAPSSSGSDPSASSSAGQRITSDGSGTRFYRIYRDLASGDWFIRGTFD